MLKNIVNIVENILTSRTKEELHFAQIFDKFFKLEDYLFCCKMVEEGYNPTRSEKNDLNNAVLDKLHKNEYKYYDIRHFKIINPETRVVSLLTVIPQNHYQMPSASILANDKITNSDLVLEEFSKNRVLVLSMNKKILKKFKKFYSSGLDSFNDFCRRGSADVENEINKIVKLITLNLILIRSGQLLPKEIDSIKYEFKGVVDYLERKTGDRWKNKSFKAINKDIFDDFIKTVNNFTQKEAVHDKEEVLRQLKSYSVRQKSLSEEIKDLIVQEDYSVEKLPLENKQQVEKLIKIVSDLNNEEVKNFFNERLPLILKKYFSIDEEYRTTLKNVEGFHAQELMTQSLNNIEKLLLAKKEDNNIDLVKELSIENRRLKINK